MKKLYIKIFNWEAILGLIAEFYAGNSTHTWRRAEIELGPNLWRRALSKLRHPFSRPKAAKDTGRSLNLVHIFFQRLITMTVMVGFFSADGPRPTLRIALLRLPGPEVLLFWKNSGKRSFT